VTPQISVALACINLTLWLFVATKAAAEWRRFHDDRAARGVLLALVLVAAALGSVISATGFFVAENGGDTQLLAGLASLARGAMIAGGIAYLASLRHRDS
jgi:hypothetical protein